MIVPNDPLTVWAIVNQKTATCLTSEEIENLAPLIHKFYMFKRLKDLKPNEIIETDYNEPLVSWISLDGQEALNALWESKGWSTYVEDDELVHYSNVLEKEEGLSVLPASAGSLAAIAKYINKNNPKNGLNFVAVLTGRKF